MRGSLTQRAYLKWQKFWEIEPWGAYRDNLHTALIAREVKLGRIKPGRSVKLDEFILVDPKSRARENKAGFLAFMRLIGKPQKRPGKKARQ